jgi:hypothetical protein
LLHEEQIGFALDFEHGVNCLRTNALLVPP